MKPIHASSSKEAAKIFADKVKADGFKPEALHEYTDAVGHPIYWRARAKHPKTGEKWIRPIHLTDDGYVLKEPEFDGGKPLYNLTKLTSRPNEQVVVVEGEWCVDALARVGVLSTTSGGNGSADTADWQPLAGRSVIVWPDNDEAGQSYAEDVASKLLALDCSVKVIDVDQLGLSPKGDAVDWLNGNPKTVALDIEALKCSSRSPANGVGKQQEMDTTCLDSLATLSEFEYEKKRKDIAKEMGVRTSALDKEVKSRRTQSDEGQGQNVFLLTPEPWDDDVEGGELLSELMEVLSTHIVTNTENLLAISFWVLHAHTVNAFRYSTRLNITAPERGCGKTLVLDILQYLTPKALRTENISTAAMFRLMHAQQPTLLVDEYDSFLRNNEDLRGALNAGWQFGGQHLRCEGDNNQVKAYKTFGPVALAGIRALPPTLQDRSIVIRMKRATPVEALSIQPFNSRNTRTLDVLNQKAARWAKDNYQELLNHDPEMPDGFVNRKADRWHALFSIADLCGWSQKARQAAIALEKGDAQESFGVLLLEDIKQVFVSIDPVTSVKLVEELHKLEDRPWSNYGRQQKPVTTTQVARLLKPFDISPSQIKFQDKNLRGYRSKDFADAFKRYLTEGQGATPLRPPECAVSSQPQGATLNVKVVVNESLQAIKYKEGSGVAGRNRGMERGRL